MSIPSTGLSRHEISRPQIKPGAARAPPLDPLYVRPKEAARLLGIGLTRVYELLHDGTLDSLLIGRSRLITFASIKRLGQR
jgi:excisionase family DNA binding protein